MDHKLMTTILRFRIRLASYNLTLKHSDVQNIALLLIYYLISYLNLLSQQISETRKNI